MKRKSTKTIVQWVFSIVAAMSIQITNAQIIYTDVNPDITSSGIYNLDLNNDGTIDFVIKHTTGNKIKSNNCTGTKTNDAIMVTPSSNCSVANYKDNSTGKSFPSKLLFNSIISNAQNWSGIKNQVMISYDWKCVRTEFCYYDCYWYYLWNPNLTGQWYPSNDEGCLGLKLTLGGHTYYGWVRISISDGTTFTLKDYAFNSIPDQEILAGQTSDNYIGVGTITVPNPLCAANSIAVPYIIAGRFSASNTITAELSDATGSFANPVSIGSVVSNVSGNINVVIPALTPSGDSYRIRVISSDPAKTSYANGNTIITINGQSYASGSNISIVGGLFDGTIWANQTNICPDNGVYLRTQSSDSYYSYPSRPCYSYQWKLNGIDIPGAINFDYSPLVAGDYSCVITAAAGSITSNIITVTAIQQPSIINAYTATGLCGDAVYLTNTGSYGAYQWKLNGNDIPDVTSFSFWATTSGNYSCVKTNNCGSVTSNTIAITIYPYVEGATITASGATAVCSGQVMLNANTGSGLSYQWYYRHDYNSQITAIAGATGSSYMADQRGDYWVTEVNSAGCIRYSNIISIQIGNPPAPTISPSSGSICHNSSIYLYANPASDSNSYQWIKDGVDITGASGYYYQAKQPGIYTVRVTISSGGCSSTSAAVEITYCNTNSKASNASSLREDISVLSEDFHTLSIAPNPASGSAKVSFKLKEPGKVSLAIYDISGRLFKTIADKKFDDGTHEVSVNTNNMRPGIYLLRMESEKILQTRKFIVIK